MIHSTDSLVRALVFQFSAGLAVIDIPISHNLIHLALKYLFQLFLAHLIQLYILAYYSLHKN